MNWTATYIVKYIVGNIFWTYETCFHGSIVHFKRLLAELKDLRLVSNTLFYIKHFTIWPQHTFQTYFL